MVPEPVTRPSSPPARLIGSILLWVFGAVSVELAYQAVTFQRFGWPKGVPLCHGSYVLGCPTPTHVVRILAGDYTYPQVGVLAWGALAGGALMLIAGRGRWWFRSVAPLAVFAGVAAGWLLRWSLWGGLPFLNAGGRSQEILRLASLAPNVGLVTGAGVFLLTLRTHRGPALRVGTIATSLG